MGLTRTVAALAPAVSLAELKAHLRIEASWTNEDGPLQIFLDAAIEAMENDLRRALVTQEWSLTLPAFPVAVSPNPKIPGHRWGIVIPKPPLQAIDSISYYDTDNVSQVLSTDVYTVDVSEEPAVVVLQSGESWPSTYARPDAVTVAFTAGYGDAASDVPQDIRNGILLDGGSRYGFRETASERQVYAIPRSVQAVVDRYKVPRIG